MTRTEPTCSTASWETKSIATTDDGNRMDSVGQDSRPRGRIRRSMTACNTCRKLKTRCDLDPRGHACRRCLSLRQVFFHLTPKFCFQTHRAVTTSIHKRLTVLKDSNASYQKPQIAFKTRGRHGRTAMEPPQSRNGCSTWNTVWVK
jgi:hypothetical protein